jgi:hypothetical protein
MEEAELTGLQRDDADTTHDGMCGKTTVKQNKTKNKKEEKERKMCIQYCKSFSHQ